MKRPFERLRLLPLLLVLLSIFSLLVFGHEHDQASNEHERPPHSPELRHASLGDDVHQQTFEKGNNGRTESTHERRSSAEASAGSSAVAEATVILRSIASPKTGFAGISKPSGLLDATTYYAKELFFLLFWSGWTRDDVLSSPSQPKRLGPHLTKAVKLLEDAADHENPDALFLLAEMNFFGNFTYPRNYSEAFKRYHELASLNGNSSAQHMLGFMYATGIGGAVKQDQAKAMLYYTFAADAGDVRSQMVIGYRHHTGIATPKDCEEAVRYYQHVADKAIDYIKSGPPGNHMLIKEAYRLADEEGGVFGDGASVSSSGPNAKKGGPNTDAHASFEDVMEYLDLMYRKGDLKAAFALGKMHYEGSRGLKRDVKEAKRYFLDVARAFWSKDGKPKTDASAGTSKLASKAAGHLGRMWLRGEGNLEQNFKIAHTWFKRGTVDGDALSQYSLGVMYLNGLGVPADAVNAADYFAAAADQDLPSAQVQMGVLMLDQGDIGTAIKYFEHAVRHAHIEAYYYLAELIHQGIGRDKYCGMALTYYKIVAEKAEEIVASFREANAAYEAGDLETALVDYMLAAEQGYENAQANVAYIIDKAQTRNPPVMEYLKKAIPIPFLWAQQKALELGDAALALVYWTRSASQANIDSTVRMGDYYLLGLGTPADSEKAASCYQIASERMQSAQAMWNLGWMHENGIGMQQDFHLAKRFYDQALETNPTEAYLPVTLALLKLRMRSYWNTVTHGRVNSIHDDDEPRKTRTFSEWIADFLANDAALNPPYDPADDPELDDWDAATTAGSPDGGDGYYEDEYDDGFFESLIIISLAGLLAFMLYYRQQRALQHRREQEEAAAGQGQGNGNAAQGEDRGMMPEAGEPGWWDWAAGGVGH
ncbi:HCP-like protein [Aulographum hederae CBS 113979]|uniref:HCP-like protein n=1 Tax=Aulographum hederae CBS 113979 TaxID=1176131 RepID=A0A6G1GY30_9PEZI|nr:HCP-like protein [Aulographum hederae CBS 113979]